MKIGGAKVWQIWRIVLFLLFANCRNQSYIHTCIPTIQDEFVKLSFAKQIYWQIHQT